MWLVDDVDPFVAHATVAALSEPQYRWACGAVGVSVVRTAVALIKAANSKSLLLMSPVRFVWDTRRV